MTTYDTLPPLPRMPPSEEQRGGDPSLVGAELAYRIGYAASNAPRTLQTRIGPSQVGTPCDRELGFMVTETPSLPGASSWSWTSTLGTALHAWLAEAFAEDNARATAQGLTARWLIETTVNVGEIGGRPIFGHADLYDRVTAGVWDWKLTGLPKIKAAKSNGPSVTYRTQAHLYGLGFERRGLPVDYVGIAYLPRTSTELKDAHFFTEPYDRELAERALTRANSINTVITEVGGRVMIPALGTADNFCSSCSWFRPGRPADETGCPGHNRTPVTDTPPASVVLGG